MGSAGARAPDPDPDSARVNASSYADLQAEVVIVGAGLVGAAQALALAQHGLSVVVVDKAEPDAVRQASYDGRVSAISHASKQVLDRLGVWPALAAHAGPIARILVQEGAGRGRKGAGRGCKPDVCFASEEAGGEPFGYMVANHRLRATLLDAVLAHPRIAYAGGQMVAAVERDPMVRVTLVDGRVVLASLLMVADGRYSHVREMLGIGAQRFTYGQHALVCSLEHTRPHQGTAVEWFFPAGPLALLPMQGGYHSCVVWTERSALATHLAALPEPTFLVELERKLKGWLGSIALATPVYSYPLNLFQAHAYHAQRSAVIGDAAHAIHPIAGQGVNLGYRDVAVLTELVVRQRRNGLDVGDAALLARYQRWRSFDATAMIAITDGLNRLFSSPHPVLRGLRRHGMRGFDRINPVKAFFMESAMGMRGDLPAMLRGEAV